MSWLSRLFGGSGAAATPVSAVEYEGFRIYPEPMAAEGGQYRLSARIEMGEGEDLKSHQMIRADLLRSHDEATEAAVFKAKQMIDQMGARLFN